MNDGSRRRFLFAASSLSLAAAVPRVALANVGKDLGERSLALKSIHTREALDVVYWRDGRYLRGALSALGHQLRDHRTGDIHPMNPTLFDLLVKLRDESGNDGRFEVISGYRSPRTNRMLAARSRGVAKRSLHMQGKAIDVRLPGTSLRKLRDAAVDLHLGGVGYYAKSGFVHLDIGRPRTW